MLFYKCCVVYKTGALSLGLFLQTLQNLYRLCCSVRQWQRYMLCDGSPDPTIGGEINTYMNLWREKEDSDSDITCVLQDSVLALSVSEGSSRGVTSQVHNVFF